MPIHSSDNVIKGKNAEYVVRASKENKHPCELCDARYTRDCLDTKCALTIGSTAYLVKITLRDHINNCLEKSNESSTL